MLHLAPLFAMLSWAAVGDIRDRRIRNWLTLSIAVTGLAQSFAPAHTVSPFTSFAGLAAGFGLTFVLFALGALGGGDVKLLAGIGAWLGPGPVLAVFAIESIAGMLIVLAQAAWQGRLAALFRNSAVVAVNLAHLNELGVEHVTATGQASKSVDRPLPYAVPVLVAVLIVAARSFV